MGCGGAKAKDTRDANIGRLWIVAPGVVVEKNFSQGDNEERSTKFGAGSAVVAVKDSVMFVCGGYGLATFDLAVDPPTKIKKINTHTISETSGAALVFNGDVMYLAGGKGLTVWDVTNAKEPSQIGGSVDTGALSLDGGAALEMCGDRLYVAGGKGMVVLDISSPKAPVKKGELIKTDANGSIFDAPQNKEFTSVSECALAQRDGVLYLAGCKGLDVFSLDNKDAPVKQGNTIDTQTMIDFAEDGTRLAGGAELKIVSSKLYVMGGNGIVAMDISQPKSPTVLVPLKEIQPIAKYGGIAAAVDGTRLLVAGGNGLGAVDTGSSQTNVNAFIDPGVLHIHGGVGLCVHDSKLFVVGGKGVAALDLAKVCTGVRGPDAV